MATTQNSLNDEGVVLVELSDDRLAEVEKAKRTGEAFVSVGQRGSELVERVGLRQDVAEVSNEGSSDPTQPEPDYRVELRAGVDDEIALNQRKAADHSEVSAEIAAIQIHQELAARENLRKNPNYYADLIAKNQANMAQKYTEDTAEIAAAQRQAEVDASIESYKIRVEDALNPRPVSAAGLAAQKHATDISERQASDALVTKDRIIFGEDSFASHAVADTQEEPQTETPRRRRAKAATTKGDAQE